MNNEQELIKRMVELQNKLAAEKLSIAKQGETKEETEALNIPADEKMKQDIMRQVEEIRRKQKG